MVPGLATPTLQNTQLISRCNQTPLLPLLCTFWALPRAKLSTLPCGDGMLSPMAPRPYSVRDSLDFPRALPCFPLDKHRSASSWGHGKPIYSVTRVPWHTEDTDNQSASNRNQGHCHLALGDTLQLHTCTPSNAKAERKVCHTLSKGNLLQANRS